MSLWTPDGEHPVDRGRPAAPAGDEAAAGPDPLSALTEEQQAELASLPPEQQAQARALIAEMAEARRQMLDTPAGVIVANHAIGLYELAAIHLGAETPDLEAAKLAIDAFAALLDAAGDRLGPDVATLRDARSQIQIAYVAVRDQTAPAGDQPG